MTTEYERPPPSLERYYAHVGSGLRWIVSVIAVVALATLLFTTFFGHTSTGPSITTSKPNVAIPERSVPKVPVPQESTVK